jgi:glycerol-3-phosphate dehydrogenase
LLQIPLTGPSADIKQYDLVKEALAERAHLLNAAPYMAHAMPIMIPVYTWWELPYMWIGAKAYDFIAGSRRVLPASRLLSKVSDGFE